MSEDAVDIDDARGLVGKHEVLVVDIRSEEDYAEVRINGSKHADPDDVQAAIDEAGDAAPDRVMLVCEDGSESAELAEKLSGDGGEFTSLDGGIKAWESAGYPVAPRSDEEYEGPPVKMPGAVASESQPDDEDEDDEERSDVEREDESDDADAEEDEQLDAAADAEAARGEEPS